MIDLLFVFFTKICFHGCKNVYLKNNGSHKKHVFCQSKKGNIYMNEIIIFLI